MLRGTALRPGECAPRWPSAFNRAACAGRWPLHWWCIVLTTINQGTIIVSGAAIAATWVRCCLNFVVPFIVSNAGVLSAHHDRRSPTSHPRGRARRADVHSRCSGSLNPVAPAGPGARRAPANDASRRSNSGLQDVRPYDSNRYTIPAG